MTQTLTHIYDDSKATKDGQSGPISVDYQGNVN